MGGYYFLEIVVNLLLKVPTLRYGWIFTFIFVVAPNQKEYEITIGNFLAFISLDFVIMLLRSVREVGAMQTHLLHVATCHVL